MANETPNNVNIDKLSEIQALLLLLLESNENEPIKSKTHLQKEMFLIINELNDEELKNTAQYEAYRYGPYSEVVDFELEKLSVMNLVITLENGKIALTEHGKKLVKELKKYAGPKLLNTISKIKKDLMTFHMTVY
ncbi:hypothetical protein [Methanocaldococcus fervens]|uniref:Uncharacterized protein n=1 Tax=Methanocaldococcus fervens (strain DSM 4213 / JCM 15782 / AG86) TaxID=573064 RepID=C7P8U1_METFA|nr:hypothetical protein [Methanocaldococcus fervens]ACV24973.1 hypothetical protein Mefer_1164 [Methanocaldococcus fervens AG86]